MSDNNTNYLDLKSNGRLFTLWVLSNFRKYKLPPIEKVTGNDPCNYKKEGQEEEFRAYQRFVASFLDYRSPFRDILIYHGLGSGKTASAINIYNVLYNYTPAWNVFLLIKASLKATWLEELGKFLNKEDKNGRMHNIKFIHYDAPNADKSFIQAMKEADSSKKPLFIFDEAHKCSRIETFNGLLMLSAKDNSPNGIIIVSATIADHVETFKIFFYILNFIEKEQAEEQKLTFKEYVNIIDKWVSRAPKPILRIHNLLFPNRATRMSIDVLGDLFPENQISVEPYSMGKTAELNIQYEYEVIMKAMEELKGKTAKDRGNILVKVLRAQQKVELLKVPTFVELTKEYLVQNFSVVIFVNFTQTLKALSEMLNRRFSIKQNKYYNIKYKSRWCRNIIT